MMESQPVCDVCLKSYKNKESLRKHKGTHFHIPSACNICNKEFKTKLLLNAHKRIVHSETSYACNECAKTFSCRNGLKTHNKALHEKKLIECSVCLKEISVHNVKRHKEYILLTGKGLGKVSDQIVESCHSALNKRLTASKYWIKDRVRIAWKNATQRDFSLQLL